MARSSNTIGVLGDLTLGSGNKIHADFNWVGSAVDADSVRYEVGDVVVHDDRIWVARQESNNVRPGTDASRWHDLGDTNVLHMWTNNEAYEAGNLVYRREDGDLSNPALLYVALQAVDAPDAGNTNPAPETNPMAGNPATAIWLRVGGQDVEILSTNRLIGNDGTVARQIYPVTRALSGSTIQYTFDAGDLEKLIDELAIPGPALANAGDADARSLVSDDSRLNGLSLNFVEFARGSTTGGTPIAFTGADPRIILRRSGANTIEITGQGTPTGTGNRDLVVNAVWTLTNPDIIAGNHISLDVAQDSDGNAVLRISADQQAISVSAPIAYDEDDGTISLDFDSNSLVVNNENELASNLDEESLTAPTDGSGVAVNLRDDSDSEPNDLQLDGADGLYVTSYDVAAADYDATESGALNTGETAVDLNLAGGRDTDRDISILARIIAAATGTDATGITIDRPDNTTHSIRVNAPPVATWAQTQTGTMEASTIIPLSKLPNLQLGNTHTFTSPATGTTTEGDLRRLVARNRGGQFVDGARTPIADTNAIAWHPGDLLVISGRDPDDENNGIFVFVGTDQGTTAVFPLPTTPDYVDDANPTNVELDRAFTQNFRAVISADTEVQTTLNTYSIAQDGTRSEVSEGSLNDVEVGNQRSISDQAAHTATGENEVQFTGSGGVLTIQTASREADDVSGVGGFINHINIGGTTYRFGPTPPAPVLRLTADPSSNEVLLYRSSAQSIEYTLSATQTRRNADGSETPNVANTVTNPVYSLTDLSNVRGTHEFDSATGVFTIPESTAGELIPTDGTLGLGASTGNIAATPALLTETAITMLYSGPRTGTTDTRTILNVDGNNDPDPYPSGTTIAWQQSGNTVTVTVGGPGGMRLWEDIIDNFDNAHAGLFIAPSTGEGSNDHRVQISGTGVFTTTAGQPASDGTGIAGLNVITSVPDTAGSTLQSAEGTSLPVLTSTALTRFYTAQRDGTGTRTALGTSDYTGVMIRAAQGDDIEGRANNNNDVIIEFTGTDAARAQNDLQTWLADTSNTGRLFFGETTTTSVRRDGTGGRLTEDLDSRVTYRAENRSVANANVQTRSTVSLTAGAEGTIADVSIPSIMYDSATNDDIAPVSLITNFRDARVAPVSNVPIPNYVTVFNSTPAFTTLQDVNPSDGDIERGRAYDVAGWQVTGTAAGVAQTTVSTAARYNYPITAAAYGTNLVSSTNTTASVARTFTFNYPMVDDPRNLQPDTDPSDTTETINYYRPWGFTTGTTAPTGATIPTLTSSYIGTPRTFGRTSVQTANGAFSISGSANDRIFFFIPTGDLHNFDIGRLRLVGVGQPFTSAFTNLGTVMAATAVSGTNISYTILRASAILQDSSAINANLTVLSS